MRIGQTTNAGVRRLAVLLALALLLLWAGVASAQPPRAQTGGDDLGDRIAQLKDRASALAGRDDVAANVRDRAQQTYQQAIALLESAQSDRAQARAFQKAAAQAPAAIREASAELRSLEEPPKTEDLRDMDSAALSAKAEDINSRLADIQSTLSDLRDRLTRLAERPEAARQALSQARTTLRTLDSRVSGADQRAAVLVAAERALLSARRESLTARIQRLQQELSSLDSRERLLEAKRTLAEARLSRDTEALAAVRLVLGRRQNEAAQTLRSQSQDKLTELHGAAQPITAAAERNLELARQLSEITSASEALATRQVRRRERVERLQRRLNLVQRQLEIGGGSIALGDVLRTQLRELARQTMPSDLKIPDGAPDIAAAELQRFQLQQARADLDGASGKAAALAASAGTQLSDGQRQSLTALLEQRREILNLLIDAEGRFIAIGRDLRALAGRYNDTLTTFDRLLNERLFWLPSFAPVHADWFARLGPDLAWAANPRAWWRALGGLTAGAANRPYIAAVAIAFMGLLLGLRAPMRRRLRHLAEPVGNVRRDTFWVTLRATLVTLLLALPFVLLPLAAGYLMGQVDQASAFTQAAAAGVIQLGVLIAFIEPFAQVCRRNGLAERHFLWDETARRGLHRSLHWLLALLVVPTLLITLIEVLNDDARRETVGRAAFMFSSLVIAGFSWRLLHPTRGVLADVLGPDGRSHWRLGYLWLPLAVGVPLMLLGSAAWGYYYTALQLQTRFFYSAGLVASSMIVYSLIVRWVTVAERRIALTRALRKREEAREVRASREAAAAAGEGAPENLDTLEIDLVQISEQTRGLIQIVIALIVAAALWLIWADTLPALQLLDQITLWQHSMEIDGKTQLTHVTLGALLLALAVGVITALAGRNLPGFLEITVLRRFSLEAGSRYAIATLFKYAIVIIGLLIAVGLVGLRWSSIQWLVAALGVGLGFGLQEIFANFVSGIVILFERPVRVGDTVTVGSVTGTVSRIRIRATTITDWDNKEVVIPNRTFITDTVINWTLSDDITRLIIRVHLALDTDTELAERLINEAIEAEPVALDEPAPSVFFVGYDDSAIIYEARVFYHDLYNLLPLQHALYKRIHAAFAVQGVSVSFPQRDLHLRTVDDSVARFMGDARRDDGTPARE